MASSSPKQKNITVQETPTLTIDTIISPHLEQRASSLVQSAECAEDAEKVAISHGEQAYKWSQQHSERDEIKRIPNTKVSSLSFSLFSFF
jgi:hypothetical protein